MQTFSGIDYLRIDIANNYGLDKDNWDDRLLWAAANEDNLETLVESADKPYLMAKAVMAYREVQAGKPVGHNAGLDVTASGLQIMAVLAGCLETAKAVNLVNIGYRADVYQSLADEMNAYDNCKLKDYGEEVEKSDVKKPLMTHYYCKVSQEDNLSPLREEVFYACVGSKFPGAEEVMEEIQSYWNPHIDGFTVTMPNGRKCKVKVTEMVDTKVEVDELDGTTFTYRFEAHQPSKRSSSLVPNIIHMIDAYIVDEMVLRASEQGFELVTVFDDFYASPQYMNKVRKNYIDIMCEIADSNLLADILTELSGEEVIIEKTIDNLSDYIRESEYPLS